MRVTRPFFFFLREATKLNLIYQESCPLRLKIGIVASFVNSTVLLGWRMCSTSVFVFFFIYHFTEHYGHVLLHPCLFQAPSQFDFLCENWLALVTTSHDHFVPSTRCNYYLLWLRCTSFFRLFCIAILFIHFILPFLLNGLCVCCFLITLIQ